MFTKIATIFTLIERNDWKIDTTIVNGMQTLCAKYLVIGSEI